MIAVAKKIQHVRCCADIHRQGVAQIRIKVRQSRAIHDQVKRLCEPSTNLGCKAEPGKSHVAIEHFYSLLEKRSELLAVPLRELLKDRRFLNHSLEARKGSCSSASPDQKAY